MPEPLRELAGKVKRLRPNTLDRVDRALMKKYRGKYRMMRFARRFFGKRHESVAVVIPLGH